MAGARVTVGEEPQPTTAVAKRAKAKLLEQRIRDQRARRMPLAEPRFSRIAVSAQVTTGESICHNTAAYYGEVAVERARAALNALAEFAREALVRSGMVNEVFSVSQPVVCSERSLAL